MIISQPIFVISNSSYRKIVHYSDERILTLFFLEQNDIVVVVDVAVVRSFLSV